MGNGKGNATGGGTVGSTAVDFSALPEGCIAQILSFTTPQDVCRLSLVSSSFRFAAEADIVWENFLPPEYSAEISDALLDILPPFSSKKELFFNLCDRPILIDGGSKSFSLDKRSGKKCYMLSPRDLFIVWGDTPRYWRWCSHADDSARFPELAELVSVCWLEIRGKIDVSLLSTGTSYAAYLVFKPTTSNYGFESQPVEVAVGLVGTTEIEKKTVYLDSERVWRQPCHVVPRGFSLFNLIRRRIGTQDTMPRRPRIISRNNNNNNNSDDNNDDGNGNDSNHQQVPEERSDGWSEVELGEFFHDGGEDGELEMSVLEVKGGNWKGGLLIQGIEIRPKLLKFT